MEQGLPRSLILRLSPADEPKPSDDEIRKLSAVMLAGQDLMALAAARRSFRDQVITEAKAAAVTVPTLGIAGSADPMLASLQELKTPQKPWRWSIWDSANTIRCLNA